MLCPIFTLNVYVRFFTKARTILNMWNFSYEFVRRIAQIRAKFPTNLYEKLTCRKLCETYYENCIKTYTVLDYCPVMDAAVFTLSLHISNAKDIRSARLKGASRMNLSSLKYCRWRLANSSSPVFACISLSWILNGLKMCLYTLGKIQGSIGLRACTQFK